MNDPKQKFVIAHISRRDIADELNNHFELTTAIPPFKANDERLTDKVCQSIAADLYDVFGFDPGSVAYDLAEHDVYSAWIEKFVKASKKTPVGRVREKDRPTPKK